MKKVYNQEKTQELNLSELSEELGYLKSSTIHHHTDAVEGVQEQGHYEVVAEYPNGGKDVEWIVDIPGVKAKPAEDYDEEIDIYVPYTEEELRKRNIEKRINELKGLLYSTDYKAVKFAEGELTEEEYAETRTLRRAYREEINQLEETLK